MNTVERIKSICKERKIAISTLEKECGFSNGYVGQLKKGSMPDDRLRKVAEFLGYSVEYLMTGEEIENFADDNALLVLKIRKDTELSKALIKYFELSDAKKKHVIETINMLVEV